MNKYPIQMLVGCIVFLVFLLGCDDGNNASVDSESDTGGDTNSDSGIDGSTCMDCHMSKEMLQASLEQDPLPEVEEPEVESEGEG